MKNITLAIDDKLLDKVRVIAAERKTTVSQLVRLYLEQIARNEDRAKHAIAELRRMSLTTEARLGPDYVFERSAVRLGPGREPFQSQLEPQGGKRVCPF